MPISNYPYYCHEQIQIPPALPDILKQFTKAAIRTQPKDVLKWSYAYFKAMAQSEIPPVKERLEFPISTQKTDSGLTPGILKILNNQLASMKIVSLSVIEEKWKDLSLPVERFQEICRIGNFVNICEWRWFLALAASDLCAVSLFISFHTQFTITFVPVNLLPLSFLIYHCKRYFKLL
ncbi:unnamed protein product [Schistosoma rodhaini]|nr:unnamed protein product [Schistosoma rodhaini]